jgi:beta-phosphoglucomutase
MLQIRAVLFDVDGVLVNAADWHFESLNLALAPFGTTISRTEHEYEFLGLTTETKLEILVSRGRLPPEAKGVALAAKRQAFRELMRTNCIPDLSRGLILGQLRERGLLLAAVSNATRESVLEMLDRSDIPHYFKAVVCGDDVSKPKPDGEPYLTCMSMLNVRADECLAVEDGQYGIEAAQAAGIRTMHIAQWEDLTIGNLEYFLRSDSHAR